MADQSDPFGQLLYRVRTGWVPLPDWALFLAAVGGRVATARPEDGRLVVALSLPARAFAAVLAGAAAAVRAFEDTPPTDPLKHFEYLRSLPAGTAITHHRANSIQQGRLLGIEERAYDGKPRVRVKLRNENLLLPVGLCTEIQVIDDPGTLKVHRQKVVREPRFLAGALPGVDSLLLSATTRLDCIIVGVRHTLEQELLAREFGVQGNARVHAGSLQAIARARDVGGSRDAYRSVLVSASADEGDAPVSASVPRAAVFDGARAFNNLRSMWPRSNWLVLLDRGLPSTEEGAATVNQEYAMRLRDSDTLEDLVVPPGIEVLSYVERL